MQYLVSESGKTGKRGWPPALRRLFYERFVLPTNHYTLSGVHFSTTPATQRLLPGRACRRQTKLLAHGYPSAIWGGRSFANTIGHLAAEHLPEIGMQPACPCQCSPATRTTKHDMGLARMHAASTSASAEVAQPTGSTLTEIAAINRSRSPGTAHTHAISLTHRRLKAV